MNRKRFLHRVRMNQFKRANNVWKDKKLTRTGATARLGTTQRTFCPYIVRYANQGTEGLVYKRLEKFLQSGPRTGDFGDGGIY